MKGWGELFADDPARAATARAIASRVRDATEFLAERPPPLLRPVAATVTFQDPCHLLHAQRVKAQPRALLAAIPGLTLTEMAEGGLCCGSAGVYNVTHPEQARQLQQRKLDRALATDAAVIATANPGCLLHLRAGLVERGGDVVVRHIVELLDEASAP